MLNRSVRDICALGAVVALGLAASAAGAQPPPSQQQQQQQASLHSALHIRPDQEQAWRTFIASTTPPAGILSELRASAGRMASMTTPQRLDLLAQNLQLEVTLQRHSADAIRQFYAVLSPDQQRIYDQVTLPRGMGGPPPRR